MSIATSKSTSKYTCLPPREAYSSIYYFIAYFDNQNVKSFTDKIIMRNSVKIDIKKTRQGTISCAKLPNTSTNMTLKTMKISHSISLYS